MANRRPYLLKRLTSGEITLEEARELFEVMQTEADALTARLSQASREPKGARAAAKGVAQPPGASAGLPALPLEELLLFLGPAAGIFAAIQKRSREPR